MPGVEPAPALLPLSYAVGNVCVIFYIAAVLLPPQSDQVATSWVPEMKKWIENEFKQDKGGKRLEEQKFPF